MFEHPRFTLRGSKSEMFINPAMAVAVLGKFTGNGAGYSIIRTVDGMIWEVSEPAEAVAAALWPPETQAETQESRWDPPKPHSLSLAAEVCKAHHDPDCRRCDETVDDMWIHPRDIEEDMT